MIRSIALAVALWSANLAQAEDCRVMDPELQGFYEGGCRKGLAHGHGHARGSAEYVGEFRNGLKHGRGVKTWPWGDRYEGEFFEDRRHGQGMYTWGAGSPWAGERYVGDYVADLREGWGVYYWPNGDKFEGQWRQDRRYGYSAMEQRRTAAYHARQAALGPSGTKVCGQVVIGIAESVRVWGETLGLADGRLTVRIVAVKDAAAGSPVTTGQVVTTDVWEWVPCR
jgi:hypothetical protein